MKNMILHKLFIIVLMLTQNLVASVCQRTPIIVEELENLTGKKCNEITKNDLLEYVDDFLELQKRSITKLKEGDFSGLGNLEEINLSDNQLKSLPKGIFKGLESLRKIDLRNNKISNVPTHFFENRKKLGSINLEGNLITQISAGAFKDNVDLDTLVLSSNLLKQLDKKVLQGLGNLELLELDWNTSLVLTDQEFFAPLKSILRISLVGNPLRNLPKTIFNDLKTLIGVGLSKDLFTDEEIKELERNLPAGADIWLFP